MTVEDIQDYVERMGTETSDDFGVTGVKGGVRTQQVPDEIGPCIYHLLNNGGIRNYCEVGVAAGGTAYLFHHFFQPAKMVLIDDDRHPSAHRRPEVLAGIDRHEIIGQSANWKTTADLEEYMDGEQFDLVFIDADHDYANCKRDSILYKQYVKVGGYLLFHDSCHPYGEYGVGKVVAELKHDDRFELVEEYKSKTVEMPLGLALFRRIM
jgi:predicted O-methyltransferase YrrM